MSYSINQKFNPSQQLAMGVNTPQLQNVNTDTVTQSITQNSVLKGVSGDPNEKNPWVTPLLTIPVGAGMIYGMGKFNKACGGTYENSLVGKISAWGQKIGEKVPFVDKIAEKIGKGVELFDKQIVSRFKILSAFFHSPTVPKNGTVLMMASGTKAELAKEATSKLLDYAEKNTVYLGVKEYTKEELKALAEKAHTKEAIDEIIKICSDPKNKSMKVESFGNLKKIPLLGKLFKNDFYLSEKIPGLKQTGREIHFSEFANKMKVFVNAEEVATAGKKLNFLGKNLPKATLRILEGLTNGTAGGKIAVLMGAFFVADSIKKAMDAPKGNGEKRKTFAENMIYNVGWYLTMPFGINLMHKFGGLKYIGMGKGKEKIQAEVAQYREKLTQFNKDVEAGVLTDKAKYLSRRKELKSLLKGDTELSKVKGFGKVTTSLMNLVHKPLKTAARILTVGLEQVRPYMAEVAPKTFSGKAINFIKNLPYKLKGGAGYPMRFGIFMFLIAPFLAKFAAKGSHIVFGKPTKSVLDEEKEPAKTQPVQPLIIPQQDSVAQQIPQGLVQPTQQITNLNNNQFVSENKENLVGNSNVQRNVTTPQANTRRYIPSETAVKVDYTQMTDQKQEDKANAAFVKANHAEAKANKYIGS